MKDILSARLRMFAGPNGSGKSTIKALVKLRLLGYYINPDDIEKEMSQFDTIDFSQFGIQTTKSEVLDFFGQSTLLEKADLIDFVPDLRFNQDRLDFFNVGVNSYWASVVADFIRQNYWQCGLL